VKFTDSNCFVFEFKSDWSKVANSTCQGTHWSQQQNTADKLSGHYQIQPMMILTADTETAGHDTVQGTLMVPHDGSTTAVCT
jgi:hypothetical protein